MWASLSIAQTTIINSLKVIDTPNETRVTIKSNRKVRTPKTFLISGKNKIVIDIDGAVNKLRKKIKFKSSIVSQIRSSQFSVRPMKVRIVLDLKEKVFYTIQHDKSLVFVLKTEAMVKSAQEDSIKKAMFVQDSIHAADSLYQAAVNESLKVIAESKKSGDIIKYAIMGGGGLIVVGGIAWFFISSSRRRKKEEDAFEALLERERTPAPVEKVEEVVLQDIDLDISEDEPSESMDSDEFQKKFSGAEGPPEGELKDQIKELDGDEKGIDDEKIKADVEDDDFELVFEKDPNAEPEGGSGEDAVDEEVAENIEEKSVAEEIVDEEAETVTENTVDQNSEEENLDLDVELDLDDEQTDIQEPEKQLEGKSSSGEDNAVLKENLEPKQSEPLIPETSSTDQEDKSEKSKEVGMPYESNIGIKPPTPIEKIEIPPMPSSEDVNQVFSEINQEEKELLKSMRDYQTKVAGYKKLMKEREIRLDAFIQMNTQINQDMIDIKRSLDESSNKLSSINEDEAKMINESSAENTAESGSIRLPETTSKPTEIKKPVLKPEPKTPIKPETIDTHVGDHDIDEQVIDVTLAEEPPKEPVNEPKYKKVYRLADTGKDVTEIAQELKMGKGQVELFLKLRDKGKAL